MRVIVTRPQAQAERWVRALASFGIDAMAVPLIDIRPLSDTRNVAAAWQTWRRYDALMFVSTPAVEHFFAQRPHGIDAAALAGGPRFWAPGPGTVAALVRHGVAPLRIDAPASDAGQFDSEALWQQVASQVRPGWRVMVVRGAEHDVAEAPSVRAGPGDGSAGVPGQGREWLAEQLRNAGAVVEFVVAYWRAPPAAQDLRQALEGIGTGRDALWLFTSAQALRHLAGCLPQRDWSQARALATHARIAHAARAAGFGVVCESRPALDDIVASIKSLQ